MTKASGVAVVATHLAHTDRRALSQAWYSALHLAQPSTASAPAARAALAPARGAPAVPRASATPAPPGAAAAHVPPRPAHAAPARAAFVDRRVAPDGLAQRVTRAVAASARAPRERATRTVALAGGRVTVLVRTDGARTRVVALCSEALRGPVERALAHVRFALAARAGTRS